MHLIHKTESWQLGPGRSSSQASCCGASGESIREADKAAQGPREKIGQGIKPRDNVVAGKCVLGSGGASSGESLESQM